MSIDEYTKALIAALRLHEMRANPASFQSGPRRSIEVGLAASEAQRFLNLLVRTPLDVDDDLARRMFGRPQDMTAGEEPWEYGAAVALEDDRLVGLDIGAGVFRLRVYIGIPPADAPEVLRRLGAA